MKKILSCIMGIILLFSCVACAKDYEYDYKYEKTSEKMLSFESSDKDFDHFINDYMHRHLRYDDYKIGDIKVGESVVFNKEYEALSLAWFNSSESAMGAGDDRIKLMEDNINGIPVDDFGYAWSAFNHLEAPTMEAGALFAQGWPFPHYGSSEGRSVGYEFNGDDIQGWTSNVEKQKIGGGLYSVTAYNQDTIEFTSPDIKIDYVGNPIDTRHAPYINIDMRMVDRVNSGTSTAIEDYLIYYKSKGDTDFSEDKKVSYKNFATISNTIKGNFAEKSYFPMYLLEDWQNINKLKIVIVPKSDKKLSINVDLNYIRLDYDARHSNNNSIILSSAKTMYEFTGNKQVLENNLNRFRQMTLFLTEALNGKSGLIDNGYMIGHEGIGNKVGYSIGQGYYDILSTPETSFYANLFFLRGIEAMAYLERAAEYEGIEIGETTVRNPKGVGDRLTYTYTAESLTELVELIKTRIQGDALAPTVDADGKFHHNENGGFWDDEKGRFIEGFDSEGTRIDYGYLAFNLEAVACKIPTEEQSKRILAWANGDTKISGDFAQGKYGKNFGDSSNDSVYGIYDREFAPRISTLKNDNQYIWGWQGSLVAYGEQVQDGGQTMFASYYDLLARTDVLGADNSFARFKEIQAWYNKVEAAAKRAGVGDSISNMEFYRAYYREIGVQMQGNNTAGGIGLDYEFVESSLLYASIPYSFFGIKSEEFGKVTVEPNLPSSLEYWKMENMYYNNINYDLTIGKNFVQIDSVKGKTKGKQIIVKLPNLGTMVYVNGVKTDFALEDGKIVVTVPFAACKVEVR